MNALTIDLALRDELPAAASGDRDAYGRIVAACQTTITAIALAITRDVHASEDIAQDAFLRGWRQLATLKNPDSFLPWLREITRNLARDHLRAQRRRPMTGESVELAIALAADTAPTPAETLLHTEQESAALEAIAALPEDSREVLLLYYREGQHSRQVAQLLGITDAAVRKRLSRARSTVREEMLRRFGEFASATAPGAGFASVVAGMVALAAPPVASATLLGSGTVVAGKSVLKVLGASAGLVAVGIAAALAGVWYGIRKPLRQPFDRQEWRALVAYGLSCSGMVLGFIAGIFWLNGVPGWIPHVGLTLAYMGGMCWASGYWLPRILHRRRAQEMLLDPIGTARRLRRGRFWRIAGPVLGLASGGGALLYALHASGRMILF